VAELEVVIHVPNERDRHADHDRDAVRVCARWHLAHDAVAVVTVPAEEDDATWTGLIAAVLALLAVLLIAWLSG
jgi:hypothetical protein